MNKAVPIAVLLCAAAIGWLYWRQAQSDPLVVSGFIEAEVIRVGSRVGGRVQQTLVQEGQAVRRGEVLLAIEPYDLQEQLKQAEAERAQRQSEAARLLAGFRSEEIEQARGQRDRAAATLDRLLAGARAQEIEIARQQLAIAEADLQLARSEHERILRLFGDRQAAPAEADKVVRDLAAAQAAVLIARQKLALLEEGTRPEEIAEARGALAEAQNRLNLLEHGYRKEDQDQARATVQAAEARVAAIQNQLAELQVVSPCDCAVEAIDLQAGDLIGQNAPAVALLDLSKLWIRAYVPELRLSEVQLGQRVPVTVNNFPDQTFDGEITFIAREAEFTPRNVQTPEERSKQVFRIKVTLRNGVQQLRVGMSADLHLGEPGGP